MNNSHSDSSFGFEDREGHINDMIHSGLHPFILGLITVREQKLYCLHEEFLKKLIRS